MIEYRCSRCDGDLIVTPDLFHTDGMIVEPCKTCGSCESCVYYPGEEDFTI